MYEEYTRYGIIPDRYNYAQKVNSFRSLNRDNGIEETLQIIRNSIGNEKEDEIFYNFLINSTSRREDRQIIEAIRDDERKHNKLLRELYKSLTGTEINNNDNNANLEPLKITYMQGLEKAFMAELMAFEKYRRALNNITDRENYNKMFEIMTDEMKHAIKYNYLISKNRS